MKVKEFRAKCITPEKRAALKKDIICYYIVRPVCDVLSMLFIKMKISATAVTKISLFPVLLSLISFSVFQNTIGFVIGWVFLLLWNIFDNIDGNIARWTATTSKSGELWDASVGYLAMFVNYFGMGIVAAKDNNIFFNEIIPSYQFLLLGAISGFCFIYPRLVMQKKSNLYGSEVVKEVKDKSNFGIIKVIALNISSINGLALLLFLVGILTHTLNILTVAYFLFNLALCVGSSYKLLKGDN